MILTVDYAKIPVQPVPDYSMTRLTAPDGPPIRQMQELEGRGIITSPSGKTTLDFGQNFVGWIRVRSVSGPAGTTMRFRHAEVLEDGEIGVRPLRSARCVDTLILDGKGPISCEPKFTFHGFRYARVVMYSDMQSTGHFHWSNSLLGFWSVEQTGRLARPQRPSADDPSNAMTDMYLVCDTFLVHVTMLMARVAATLNAPPEEQAFYQKQTADLRDAFAHEYLTPSGRLAGDTQTASASAIQFNLLPTPEQQTHAAERLSLFIRQRSRFIISTSFAGTPHLGHALTKVGLSHVFYRTLLHRECPGWLYPVTMGASTAWECWDSMLPDGRINPGDMTSFNHYALGAVASWMHQTIAGPEPVESGWRVFRVEPVPGGNLAEYRSVYGDCRVRWEVKDTQTGAARGVSDFNTLEGAGGTRRSFSITQCKSAEGEGQEGVWLDEADQLQRYLSMEHRNRRAPQRPAYGILAMGRRVRFFQYDRSTDTIRSWRPITPLPDGREYYYLAREATEVQTALREILNRHRRPHGAGPSMNRRSKHDNGMEYRIK